MRFYDIQEGNILIKGRDIREYGQRELRDMIGYVPQKAFLFSGTIADNLRHGKKDATDLEMHHAAAIAQIDDFIREHKKGLDAPVSQLSLIHIFNDSWSGSKGTAEMGMVYVFIGITAILGVIVVRYFLINDKIKSKRDRN